MIVAVRNFLYSARWLKVYRVSQVVISVGNITAGGTGKTPLVIWLYNKITENSKRKTQHYKCAILTRGYKTDKRKHAIGHEPRGTKGDEPAILAESCPRARVIVNPDRVAGANEAVDKFGANVLLLDDGFQHRRLGRDIDIVTIDATRPFGYGKLVPAGLLREPIAALKRANAAVITRSDQAAGTKLSRIERRLLKINPHIVIARAVHTPICAKTIDYKEIPIEQLKAKKIFAFCGIGNPLAFLSTIQKLGSNLVGWKIYDDHYPYTQADIADISQQAQQVQADLVLTTEKDWQRLPSVSRNPKKDIFLAYLAIELRLVSGEDKITQLIEDALAGKIPEK